MKSIYERKRGGSVTRDFYEDKVESYFAGARQDYIEALPNNPRARILELGCGSGDTGALALSEGKCSEYFGIELDTRAAERARGRLTQVLEGDIEALDIPWPKQHFDALIMSEVLEHLVDPWGVLRRLMTLVRPGGLVMASSPNVSNHKVILQLLRGRWDLTETGVMDRAHLRWFTPATFREMFEDTGIRVDYVAPLVRPGRKARLANALTLGRLSHLFVGQINLMGHVPHA